MKLNESWLREWINPPLTTQALADCLTFGGIHVEAIHVEQNETIFDIELTPNRGDCLSVLGIAREIAALTATDLIPPFMIADLSIAHDVDLTIHNHAQTDCWYYAGLQLNNIDSKTNTPPWLKQRLQCSGLARIHPIVDILNYVMLELGQPLHAFDISKIDGDITIRHAQNQETIQLLDGKIVTLKTDTLIIADQQQPLALAGIMSGLSSGVTAETTHIFIESAHFTPNAIAGRARSYGLHTEASHRFERGVDPTLPAKALARVLQLCQMVYPNLAYQSFIPMPTNNSLPAITLSIPQVNKILGIDITMATVKKILQRLKMTITAGDSQQWQIVPPIYRFDITEAVDIVEEIIRIYGYRHVPWQSQMQALTVQESEKTLPPWRLKRYLADQGFHEIITYSFIEQSWQQRCDPLQIPWQLMNPLSATMKVMRTNLWPGLLQTAQYNMNRQQVHLKLFEMGLRFRGEQQTPVLSGLMTGDDYPEQWHVKKRAIDFFDGKAVIETLLQYGDLEQLTWQALAHPALHPGQAATIFHGDAPIAECGLLHPQLQQQLGFNAPIFLFEVDATVLQQQILPTVRDISKYPSIRRDLAIIIDTTITAAAIEMTIKNYQDSHLIAMRLFDVYQGKSLPSGKKSIAIGLFFQAHDHTLHEEEIQNSIENIVKILAKNHQAFLRE